MHTATEKIASLRMKHIVALLNVKPNKIKMKSVAIVMLA
jgi:hypothetical protein